MLPDLLDVAEPGDIALELFVEARLEPCDGDLRRLIAGEVELACEGDLVASELTLPGDRFLEPGPRRDIGLAGLDSSLREHPVDELQQV